MKKSNTRFEWNKETSLSKSIAVVLFVALPLTGFIVGTNYQKAIRGENQVVTLKPFNVDTTATTPMTNWKTYKSKRNNLTFKYPPELTVAEPTNDHGIYIETPKLDSSLLVIYNLELQGLELTQYIDKFWNTRKTPIYPYAVGQYQGQSVDDLTDQTRGRNIFFTNSTDEVFRIFYFVNNYVQPKYQPIINTIISTIE